MTTSIIIPVYNTSATLGECVASVLAQTATDIEVVLVDDGSTDGSPALCDEWARRDSRVRVIHRTNGGLSAARNSGIEAARGDCLMFVDSDDAISPDTVEAVTAVLLADGACDMVEFAVTRVADGRAHDIFMPRRTVYDDMSRYWFMGRAYEHSYACNKAFRRRLFATLRFAEGRVFEDMELLPRLLRLCRRVCTTPRGRYYYRLNAQGITATATGSDMTSLLDAHLAVADGMLARADAAAPHDRRMRRAADRYYMHVLNIQIQCCMMCACRPRLGMRRVQVLHLPKQYIVKGVLLRLLGVGATCRLIRACKSVNYSK